MVKLIILEGARGGGKSTIATKLRSSLKASTCINFTGFPDDGEEGLIKSQVYYQQWLEFIANLAEHSYKLKMDYTIICDRFFFSEMVFSHLYKKYDFRYSFRSLLLDLDRITGIEVYVFYLQVDDHAIAHRLMREKTDHFAQWENLDQIRLQQEEYERMWGEIKELDTSGVIFNIDVHEIKTGVMTIGQVFEAITNKMR